MTTLSTAAETWNLKSTRDENPAEPFIFGETDSCVGRLVPRWSAGNVVKCKVKIKAGNIWNNINNTDDGHADVGGRVGLVRVAGVGAGHPLLQLGRAVDVDLAGADWGDGSVSSLETLYRAI